MPAGRGYDLVHRQGEQNEPLIVILRDWLQDEMQEFVAAPGD